MSSRDKARVDRILAGDRAAFREFFDDLFPRLFRFALVRLSYDESAAEEIAQATLCKAIRKLETYHGEAPLFSWLCTFCRHELWSRNKKDEPLTRIEDSPEMRAAIDSLAAGDEFDPEAGLRREDAIRLVHGTLDNLPSRYGSVLEWKYLRGMTVKEIAARLEVGPKAAESMLTRARDAFRDAFSSMARKLPPRGEQRGLCVNGG